MSSASTSATAPEARRRFHGRHWVVGALIVVLIGALANLLGWDISGWLEKLWDTLRTISFGYIVAGVGLLTLQTSAVGFAWYSILRFGYQRAGVRLLPVLAAYATSVALNSILPANLGTLVLLAMLTMVFSELTFAGVLGAAGVQKIFFVVIGAFPYVYLFLTVGGSFNIKFGFIKAHPWTTGVLLIGGAFLIVWVVRLLWPRMVHWWEQAKEGGKILGHTRSYLGRVVLPEAISWIAMLGLIGVFLAAYSIPVSFHTLMRVVAGNSIANVTSATPGGAGVTQAFNDASLNGITNATNATAYSVAQQLISTAWSIVFAIILMAWAFGWTGGRALVADAYSEAKAKADRKKHGGSGDAAETDKPVPSPSGHPKGQRLH